MSTLTQQISRAELERARLDVRGEALRKTAARLQELASGAALALTAADSSLMQIDRDYTKLHAEVRRRSLGLYKNHRLTLVKPAPTVDLSDSFCQSRCLAQRAVLSWPLPAVCISSVLCIRLEILANTLQHERRHTRSLA